MRSTNGPKAAEDDWRDVGRLSSCNAFAVTAFSTQWTIKKRDILFLIITLANLHRFLQFLYYFNREDILHATMIHFITSPDFMCAPYRVVRTGPVCGEPRRWRVEVYVGQCRRWRRTFWTLLM